MSSCKHCDENLLREKLGRCRRCVWLSLLLALSCSLGWLLLQHTDAEYVQQVAALFGAVFAVLLFCAHLVVGGYYRITGQEGIFSAPSEPEPEPESEK